MTSKPTSRDRLTAAAGTLFYERGITTTNMDAVAQAAGLTKPTLYAHFPSKAALVAAALQRRHDEQANALETWLAGIEDVRLRPLGVFGWLTDRYDSGGPRGCSFLNAAAELTDPEDPARPVVQGEKHWLLDLLTTLCQDAGLHRPDRLASQLLLLIDGVAGRILVDGSPAAATATADATEAAAQLIRAADPTDRSGPTGG